MDKTKAAAVYKDLVDKVRDDYLVNPRKNKNIGCQVQIGWNHRRDNKGVLNLAHEYQFTVPDTAGSGASLLHR